MARYARRPSGQRRPPGLWKHGPVPVVGLIGGIGAGKSQVAAALASRGAAVLDADAIGHALLDQRPTREQVVARFGKEVLDRSTPEDMGEGEGEHAAPRIDRATLGRIVFANPHARRALEAILHPRMRKTVEKAIHRVSRRREAKMVVLDAAVLLEAGWEDLCDAIVFVEAPEAVRQARLAAARGWSAADLAARQASQWPLGRKRGQADHVLVNDATPEDLEARIDSLWGALTRPPAYRPRPDDDREPPGPGILPVADDGAGVDATRPGPGRPSRPGTARSAAPRGRSRRKR